MKSKSGWHALAVVWLAGVFWIDALEGAERPNFLIVLADDLGYGDLGCYGHPHIKTPFLDRFAAESLRLTDCYSAAASCSPARTGLMTGRTPYRAGIYKAIPFLSPVHLRSSEVTIATLLREAGYATCHVGKWHLNGWFNLPGHPQPSDHGFEHWFSTQNNALPNHRNPYNFVRNSIPVGPLRGYAADLVVGEATRWLRARGDDARPFFLYVCLHEPHEPIATGDTAESLYHSFADPSQRAYYGNVTQMDVAFGRLLRELRALELEQNTFVFFTSDNGPALTRYHPYGSTGPLRAKKGHVYEGGIRVPGIVRWPGKTPVGGVSHEPVCGVDLLPTICEVAGLSAPADRALDGSSILPLIEGKPIRRRQPLYWQYNLARSAAKVALRDGDWKILADLDPPFPRAGANITAEQMELLKTVQLTGFELYNLREDVAESDNLAGADPARLRQMKDRLTKLFRVVQRESPVWPSWDSPRYEASRIGWPDYQPHRQPPK